MNGEVEEWAAQAGSGGRTAKRRPATPDPVAATGEMLEQVDGALRPRPFAGQFLHAARVLDPGSKSGIQMSKVGSRDTQSHLCVSRVWALWSQRRPRTAFSETRRQSRGSGSDAGGDELGHRGQEATGELLEHVEGGLDPKSFTGHGVCSSWSCSWSSSAPTVDRCGGGLDMSGGADRRKILKIKSRKTASALTGFGILTQAFAGSPRNPSKHHGK